jgi:hypothetical protein
MSSTELRELEAMAAKLLTAARKLPPGPERHIIFKEIGRFRARIFALQKSVGQQVSVVQPLEPGFRTWGFCRSSAISGTVWNFFAAENLEVGQRLAGGSCPAPFAVGSMMT